MYVGADEREFRLHYHLLQANSNFFNSEVLNEVSRINSPIRLPALNPDVFQYFVHWLYNKTLNDYHNCGLKAVSLEKLKSARVSAEKVWNDEDSGENYIAVINARAAEGMCFVRSFPLAQLVGLYILAYQLQVPGLKDQIVTKVVQVYGKNYNARVYYWGQSSGSVGAKDADAISAINLAYHNLNNCFLKRLLVHLYVENVCDDHISTRAMYHPEFLCDVVDELRRRLDPNFPVPSLEICQWHEHHDEKCSILDEADGDGDEDEFAG